MGGVNSKNFKRWLECKIENDHKFLYFYDHCNTFYLKEQENANKGVAIAIKAIIEVLDLINESVIFLRKNDNNLQIRGLNSSYLVESTIDGK